MCAFQRHIKAGVGTGAHTTSLLFPLFLLLWAPGSPSPSRRPGARLEPRQSHAAHRQRGTESTTVETRQISQNYLDGGGRRGAKLHLLLFISPSLLTLGGCKKNKTKKECCQTAFIFYRLILKDSHGRERRDWYFGLLMTPGEGLAFHAEK